MAQARQGRILLGRGVMSLAPPSYAPPPGLGADHGRAPDQDLAPRSMTFVLSIVVHAKVAPGGANWAQRCVLA